MAKTPSDSLLAKDAIGQALSISSKKAKEDRAQLINDYNMAIAEIYNILGLIDSGVYIKTLPEVSASHTGNLARNCVSNQPCYLICHVRDVSMQNEAG